MSKRLIATFDFGTTAIKFVVVNGNLEKVYSAKQNIDTYFENGFIEQSPKQWYEVFKNLLCSYEERDKIDSFIFSGQMQDLIFIDGNGNAIGNAILYNDQRARNYVKTVNDSFKSLTYLDFNGSIPLLKYYWMCDKKPNVIKETTNILFSPKDYISSKLTGRFVVDATTASTTGMINIKKCEYCLNLDPNLKTCLPELLFSDNIIGKVKPVVSAELGLSEGDINVFVGVGDAGATTFASGIEKPGDININLGTSGWISTVSNTPRAGVFNLRAVQRNRYINVIPILNAGSVHKWVSGLVFGSDGKKYDKMENFLSDSKNYETTLLCLPYLVGERFPVADSDVRGCFIGLEPSTSLLDMSISALEGVAFSLKQGMEKLEVTPKSISIIGGGALEPFWNQIFADVLEQDIITFSNSEFLPSQALAKIALYIEGNLINHISEIKIFHPHVERFSSYRKKYLIFKKIYPAIRTLF